MRIRVWLFLAAVVATMVGVNVPAASANTPLTWKVSAGGVVRVPVGVANSVVVGNVTVTEPSGAGYVTVYPCTVPRPGTSTVNVVAGATVANTAPVTSDASGHVCVYTSVTTHIVWDTLGVLPPGGVWNTPTRHLDTRTTTILIHPATGKPFYATVERWAPLVYATLLQQGLPAEYTPGVLAQIQQESSGLPNAVNGYDTNWRSGYASFGLLQIIYPTFATHATSACQGPRQSVLVNGVATVDCCW